MIWFMGIPWNMIKEYTCISSAPIIIVLLLLGAQIVLAQGSTVATFIYTLF
ncbi:MAG: hypothetical protein KAJ95_03415 [Gammaproteobacteria bacterium]|nr:hypothetical protein [Gammaproteobacteria bacterium]